MKPEEAPQLADLNAGFGWKDAVALLTWLVCFGMFVWSLTLPLYYPDKWLYAWTCGGISVLTIFGSKYL